MQITNASSNLIGYKEIEITKTDVRLGKDPKAAMFAFVFMVVFIVGWLFFKEFLGGLVSGLVIGYISAKLTKDRRLRYTGEQIASVEVLGLDRVGTKSGAGSVGGAVVGDLLFGGVGAIVGASASGNKIEQFHNIGIKFVDGAWLAVSNKGKGIVASTQFNLLVRLAGNKNACPF